MFVTLTAGVGERPPALRDGAGGEREEQEDVCRCRQHQTGRGAAQQGDLVHIGKLGTLT